MRPHAIAPVIMILMMSGCDNGDRISRLEGENADLKAQMDKSQRVSDYDLQAKRSKDAKAWFNENWSQDKDTLLLTFINHYDKSLNKCFIVVEYHYSFGTSGSWTNDMTLWDVYENAKYGDFLQTHYFDVRNGASDGTPVCEINTGAKCTTLDQFNSFIRPYLNQ